MGFLFFVLQHMHIYKQVLNINIFLCTHIKKKKNQKIKMLKYKMKSNHDNILKS